MTARNMDDMAELFQTLRFKKALIGGVRERDVWKQLDRLQKEYRSAYEIQQERYDALLQEREKEIVLLKTRLSQESAHE